MAAKVDNTRFASRLEHLASYECMQHLTPKRQPKASCTALRLPFTHLGREDVSIFANITAATP